jgi:hypothetical protein
LPWITCKNRGFEGIRVLDGKPEPPETEEKGFTMSDAENAVVVACEKAGSEALTETVIRDGRIFVRVCAEGNSGLVLRLLAVGEEVEGIPALVKDLRA